MSPELMFLLLFLYVSMNMVTHLYSIYYDTST